RYYDVETLDPLTKLQWQPNDVLSCRDQPCSPTRRGTAQQVDLRSAEQMMVGEPPRSNYNCVKRPKGREEFFRASDPGEGQKTLASQPLPGRRCEDSANHRNPGA